MITVAIIASRRREVSIPVERFPVDALAVKRHLVGGNLVRSHARGIGMAPAASRSHVCRIDGAAGILHSANAVGTVAVNTDGNVRIPLEVLFAVRAGKVFGVLIDARLRVVIAHEIEFAVARGAKSGDLLAGRPADIAFRATHRVFRSPSIHTNSRIPSVAVMTGKPFLKMDVLARKFHRFLELRIELLVTLDARTG